MPNEDPPIDPEALRIMRAWPQVFGPGPWPVTRTALGWGFCCGRGWFPLIEQLSADIAVILHEDGLSGFRVLQVKEKFGGLRVYVRNANARILARIAVAEEEAAATCERCGARPAPLHDADGWLTTLCDRCLQGAQRG